MKSHHTKSCIDNKNHLRKILVPKVREVGPMNQVNSMCCSTSYKENKVFAWVWHLPEHLPEASKVVIGVTPSEKLTVALYSRIF